MKKSILWATALIVMAFILLAPWEADAGRGSGGGSFFLSTGGFFIGSGNFGHRGAESGFFFATPGLSFRAGSAGYGRHGGFRDYGRFRGSYGRHFRRDHLYRRPFRRHYWYDRAPYRHRGGGARLILHDGDSGITLGIGGGSDYGEYGYSRGPYRRYERSRYTSAYAAGRSAPYGSRIWVPGRMTGQGFSRGHWEYRPLGAVPAGDEGGGGPAGDPGRDGELPY